MTKHSAIDAATQKVTDAELETLAAAKRLHRALGRAFQDHADHGVDQIHDILASIVSTGAGSVSGHYQQLQMARGLLTNRQALSYQQQQPAKEAATDEDQS